MGNSQGGERPRQQRIPEISKPERGFLLAALPKDIGRVAVLRSRRSGGPAGGEGETGPGTVVGQLFCRRAAEETGTTIV